MEDKKKKRRKIQNWGPKFKREALSLLVDAYGIKACKDCTYPTLPGYCCTYCGSVEP